MIIYTCDRCKWEFDNVVSYDSHKKSKKECVIDSNIDKKVKRHICPGCTKVCSRPNNLKTHMEICEVLRKLAINNEPVNNLPLINGPINNLPLVNGPVNYPTISNYSTVSNYPTVTNGPLGLVDYLPIINESTGFFNFIKITNGPNGPIGHINYPPVNNNYLPVNNNSLPVNNNNPSVNNNSPPVNNNSPSVNNNSPPVNNNSPSVNNNSSVNNIPINNNSATCNLPVNNSGTVNNLPVNNNGTINNLSVSNDGLVNNLPVNNKGPILLGNNNNIKNINGTNTIKKIVNKFTKQDVIINPCGIAIVNYSEPQSLIGLSSIVLNSIINSKDNIYVTYFKIIHCDPDRREYHNVHYVDETQLRICTSKGWLNRNAIDVIMRIIEDERNCMIKYYDRFRGELDENERKKLSSDIISLQVTKKTGYNKVRPKHTLASIHEQIMEELRQSKQMHDVTYQCVILRKPLSVQIKNEKCHSFKTSILHGKIAYNLSAKSSGEDSDGKDSNGKDSDEESILSPYTKRYLSLTEFDSTSDDMAGSMSINEEAVHALNNLQEKILHRDTNKKKESTNNDNSKKAKHIHSSGNINKKTYIKRKKSSVKKKKSSVDDNSEKDEHTYSSETINEKTSARKKKSSVKRKKSSVDDDSEKDEHTYSSETINKKTSARKKKSSVKRKKYSVDDNSEKDEHTYSSETINKKTSVKKKKSSVKKKKSSIKKKKYSVDDSVDIKKHSTKKNISKKK